MGCALAAKPLGVKYDRKFMRGYLIKFLLVPFFIFMFGCQESDDETISFSNAIEMSMRTSNESKVNSIIQALTNKIENGNSHEQLTRGFYYLLIKDTADALKDFKFALKLDSNNSNAYLGIAVAYFLTSDSSLYYLNKSIKNNPRNSFAYFYRHYFQKNKIKKLFDLNKAIELNPDVAMFYTWRGVFYDGVDSSSLSMKDFNKAILLDDSIVLNYAFMGTIYKYQKNLEEALKYFSLQIKFDPNNSNGYENRGDLYHELKIYDKAILDYKKALQFSEKNIFNYKPSYNYKIARNYSLLKNDSVYNYLELSCKADSDYLVLARTEKDFDNIRNTKQFNYIMKKCCE